MSEDIEGIKKDLEKIFDESHERLNFENLRSKISDIRFAEKSKKEKLAYFLKVQVENLERVGSYIEANIQSLSKLQSASINVKQMSQQNLALTKIEPEKMKKVSNIKRNITVVLQRLNDFIGVNQKLKELEALLGEQGNYGIIQQKLEALLALERALMSSGRSDNTSKFAEKFKQVHEFKNSFMEKVFSCFDNYIVICRTRPEVIKQAVEIADKNDLAEQTTEYSKAVLARLQGAAAKRFDEQLGNKTEINMVLENIKFTVDDLLLIFEYLQPIFPEKYKVFAFMEEVYKDQIQVKVLPFISDFNYLKENPGTLVYLINWLNTYEKLLTKVGFTTVSFGSLRDKIKESSPIFMKHIEKMFNDFLENISKNDAFIFRENFNPENVFETSTPEDILHFVNEQIDFLGKYLDESMMTDLLQVWFNQIEVYIHNFVD